MLYLTGTVGVGAGIVEAGSSSVAREGFAGEVGHMPVGDPTVRCGCGRRGCWEASVGLHAMLRGGDARAGYAVAPRRRWPAGAAHRRAVRDRLARLGDDVGLGLAVLAQVLDPAVVVLGGYFVPLGDLVIGPARRTLDQRLLGPVRAARSCGSVRSASRPPRSARPSGCSGVFAGASTCPSDAGRTARSRVRTRPDRADDVAGRCRAPSTGSSKSGRRPSRQPRAARSPRPGRAGSGRPTRSGRQGPGGQPSSISAAHQGEKAPK